ncbi:hypothetical protein V6N11_062886 [Hibiscus sabdariffa]|uniref:Uncharacterized protein n=1 Tax=Hibiscus sabdariffa TaxID=183260 RepID=A0ABR2NPJ6_9ROSI
MGTKMVRFSKSIGMPDPTSAEIEVILEAFEGLNDLPWIANPILHTVPSTLRVKRLEPSLEPHGSSPDLERTDQIHDHKNPTQLIEPMSNQPNAPTWVTSKRYPTR